MKFVKIKKITPTEKKDIFHLTVEKNHNYFANNLCVHNCEYRGEIIVRFKYIPQQEDICIKKLVNYDDVDGYQETCGININRDRIYKKGDKICQLVVEKTVDCIFAIVDVLDNTARGEGGFGSTGK